MRSWDTERASKEEEIIYVKAGEKTTREWWLEQRKPGDVVREEPGEMVKDQATNGLVYRMAP